MTRSSEDLFVTASFDLHVLSTPPAFILSQDQTLMFECLFPLRTYSGFLFLKSKGLFRSSFDVFLLFLRSIFVWTSYPLEWKFIEFSGLFHCLIIKVLVVRSRKRLCYLITSFRTCQALFLKLFKFFSMCFCSLEQLVYLITTRFVCQPLFLSFSNFLNCSNCLNFFFVSNSFVILP